MNLDRLFAEARARIHKRIDIRCALALGKDRRSTINRRYGQIYKRGKHGA